MNRRGGNNVQQECSACGSIFKNFGSVNGPDFQRSLAINMHPVCWVSLKIWLFFKCLMRPGYVFLWGVFWLVGGLLLGLGGFFSRNWSRMWIYFPWYKYLSYSVWKMGQEAILHKSLRWIGISPPPAFASSPISSFILLASWKAFLPNLGSYIVTCLWLLVQFEWCILHSSFIFRLDNHSFI